MNRQTISLRLAASTRANLEAARIAVSKTGKTQTDLIEECIKASLKNVVRRFIRVNKSTGRKV